MITPGTQIDSYTVVDCIGSGGYGSVYKCTDSELNRIVALKLLASDMITSEESRARFEREAKILCTIKHAHVTRCYRTGMYDDTTPYIAMEFIEGRSLQSIIDEKTVVPWPSVVDYGLQMCDALTEIHHHGIIHRDLKPDNFMLSNDGVLKLVDFGLARISGTATLTETGLLLGTVYYMSPEACVGQKIDERADIYSLGCTLFFALFGRPPFDAATPLAIIHQHANAEIEIPASQVIPASLAHLLLTCLAKDPDNRYQSTKQLASALSQIQENAGELYKSSKSNRKLPLAVIAMCSVGIAATLFQTLTLVKEKLGTNSVLSKSAPSTRKIPQSMHRLETLESIGKVANSPFLTNQDKVAIFREYLANSNNKNPLFLGMVWHRLADFEPDNPAKKFHCKQQAAKYLQEFLKSDPEHNKSFRSACIDSAESLIFTGRYVDAQKSLNLLDTEEDEWVVDGSLGRVFEKQQQAHLWAATGQMLKCESALRQEQKALAVKNTLFQSTFGASELHPSDSAGMRASECAARLAFVLAVQGKVDAAAKAAKSAIEYSMNDSINGVERMSALGDMCMFSNYSIAERAYRQFLRLWKSHWVLPTQLKLIQCLLLQKKFDESNSLLETVSDMQTTNPYYVELLQAQINSGDLQGKDTEQLCAKLTQINSKSANNQEVKTLDALFNVIQHYRTTGNTRAMKDELSTLSVRLKSLPFSFRTDDTLLLLLNAEMPEQMLDICDNVIVDPKSQIFTELQLYKVQALELLHNCDQAQLLLKKISVEAVDEAPRVNAKLTTLKALYATPSRKNAIALLQQSICIYERHGLNICPDHFLALESIVQLAKTEGLADLARKYEQKLSTLISIKSKLPPFGNAGQLPLWRG